MLPMSIGKQLWAHVGHAVSQQVLTTATVPIAHLRCPNGPWRISATQREQLWLPAHRDRGMDASHWYNMEPSGPLRSSEPTCKVQPRRYRVAVTEHRVFAGASPIICD